MITNPIQLKTIPTIMILKFSEKLAESHVKNIDNKWRFVENGFGRLLREPSVGKTRLGLEHEARPS
jgi:hypothetical protein